MFPAIGKGLRRRVRSLGTSKEAQKAFHADTDLEIAWAPLLLEAGQPITTKKRKKPSSGNGFQLNVINGTGLDACLKTWSAQAPPNDMPQVAVCELVQPLSGNLATRIEYYSQYLVKYAAESHPLTFPETGVLRSRFARSSLYAGRIPGNTPILILGDEPFGEHVQKFVKDHFQDTPEIIILAELLFQFLMTYPQWARRRGGLDTIGLSSAYFLPYQIDVDPFTVQGRALTEQRLTDADKAFIDEMTRQHPRDEDQKGAVIRSERDNINFNSITRAFFTNQEDLSYFAFQKALLTLAAYPSNKFFGFMPMDMEHDPEPTLITAPDDCKEFGGLIYLGGQHHLHPRIVDRFSFTHMLSMGAFQFNDLLKELRPGLQFCEVVLVDDGTPFLHLLEQCVAFVRQALASGGRVLIYCHRGMSRSPSATIACLMAIYKMSFEEAFALVSRLRPKVCPNPALQRDLLHWEFQVFGVRKSLTVIYD